MISIECKVLKTHKDLTKGGAYMSKKTITILVVVAVIVVLAAVGFGIHHMMNPVMPVK